MSLTGVPSGIELDEVEARLASSTGVDDRPRSSRLAAEHDRDRADRAPGRAGAGSTDALLAARASDASRPLRHRALHDPGRAAPSRTTRDC